MPDIVDRPSIVNDPKRVNLHHSTFPEKEIRLTTEQFGIVKPHVAFVVNSDEDFDYRPEYKTRSYSLRAPLMQDVHRKLSYVKVDLPAILPLNFEKFFTNPVVGDDVLPDVGTSISNGFSVIHQSVNSVLSSAFAAINGANNFTPTNLTNLIKALIFAELFFSRGNLLHSLGCRISKQFGVDVPQYPTNNFSFDAFFDSVIARILAIFGASSVGFISVRFGSVDRAVRVSAAPVTPNSLITISFRELLNEARSSSDWSILDFQAFPPAPGTVIAIDFSYTPTFYPRYCADAPFNFGLCCAYQLAIAEFMTNDKVDHIYSSELYRQYIGSLVADARAIAGFTYRQDEFTYNGVKYMYDYLSGHNFNTLLSETIGNPSLLFNNAFLEYFISILGYKRSLRYKDYFVSSRVSPLAVGNVDVAVNANLVSVVDISRNIQVQRFLNAVNHAGRRLSNYIKAIFGNDITPDRHVPHWIADIDEMVYTSEVENTGVAQQTAQNSVTAVFTGNSGNKQLHFYTDLPGFVIGLTSYDIERAYADSIDRAFFIEDRYDMFIPEMQFVGDQPVFAQELDSADDRAFGTPFGYQYRDMQYKLRYAVADGGFVEFLPGYGFLYDPASYTRQNISPDFIRSRVSELDKYYLSLTGYSLGSYFHFISVVVNNFIAKRPMISNPKILE